MGTLIRVSTRLYLKDTQMDFCDTEVRWVEGILLNEERLKRVKISLFLIEKVGNKQKQGDRIEIEKSTHSKEHFTLVFQVFFLFVVAFHRPGLNCAEWRCLKSMRYLQGGPETQKGAAFCFVAYFFFVLNFFFFCCESRDLNNKNLAQRV